MRALALVMFLPSLAFAATYEVGPGQTYANVGDVPWPSIAAGDTVRIHARPTPYAEKFIVNATGTEQAPIVIEGVPDADGNLPILDGDGAVEAANEHGYQDDDRSIIKIGDASTPSNANGGSYITIQYLHIRNANPGYTFSSQRLGNDVAFAQNAAGIWLQHGDHLTIRGCELENNGNGIFGAWGDGTPVSSVLIEGNDLHDNGIPGDAYEHNSYVQVDGVTYQFNHYGPPCPTCQGNNLKDRSSSMVARYNWLQGGERVMDLVDNPSLTSEAAYFTAYVYGNVLIKDDVAGNNAVVHFGGDGNDAAAYRTTLYFWNNTVVGQRSGRTTLLQLSSASQTAHVINDVVALAPGSGGLAILDADGNVALDHDWIPSGATDALGSGTVDSTGVIEGSDPGFVDLANLDVHLAAGSPLIDAARALPAALAAYPVDQQYLADQQGIARPDDGTLDIGAYEFGAGTSSTGSSASSSGSTASSSSSSSSAGSTLGSSSTSGSSGSSGHASTGGSSAGSTSGTSAASGASGSLGGSSGATGGVTTAKGGCGSLDGSLAILALGVLALRRRS